MSVSNTCSETKGERNKNLGWLKFFQLLIQLIGRLGKKSASIYLCLDELLWLPLSLAHAPLWSLLEECTFSSRDVSQMDGQSRVVCCMKGITLGNVLTRLSRVACLKMSFPFHCQSCRVHTKKKKKTASNWRAKIDRSSSGESKADGLRRLRSAFLFIRVTPVIARSMRIWSDKSKTAKQLTNWPKEFSPNNRP